MIAKPFSPGNAFPAEEVARERITFDKAMIGSCTNGSYDDLLQAALVLRAARARGDETRRARVRRVSRARAASAADRAARSAARRRVDRRGVPLGRRRDPPVVVRPLLRPGARRAGAGQRAITSFNRNWQNRMGVGGEGYLAFTDPQIWIALATLTFLEIVLGVDNIIFISILSGSCRPEQQKRARRLGLLGAMVTRILLLFSLAWIIRLTAALVHRARPGDLGPRSDSDWRRPVPARQSHLRDPRQARRRGGHASKDGWRRSFASVIVQIMLLDIVFSLDSVITAVGMVDELWVMIAAVMIAVGIMMVSAEPISAFVHRHPTVKMLALSFLLLIGMSLIAEGFDQHISKGYIYFAMGFSVFVEMINLRIAKKGPKLGVHLHEKR